MARGSQQEVAGAEILYGAHSRSSSTDIVLFDNVSSSEWATKNPVEFLEWCRREQAEALVVYVQKQMIEKHKGEPVWSVGIDGIYKEVLPPSLSLSYLYDSNDREGHVDLYTEDILSDRQLLDVVSALSDYLNELQLEDPSFTARDYQLAR